jgi:uncharacterized protein (TIGR02284 family)
MAAAAPCSRIGAHESGLTNLDSQIVGPANCMTADDAGRECILSEQSKPAEAAVSDLSGAKRTMRSGMSNPSKELKEAEGSLRLVIEKLIDSQESFQKIAEGLKDEDVKQFFLAESLRRAQFRGDLETVLHQEGVHDIKESGTAAGTFTRGWGELKAKLGWGDHALLAGAEEQEDAVKEAYADALNGDFPLPIRQLLVSQAAHVEASHDWVRAARNSRDAA